MAYTYTSKCSHSSMWYNRWSVQRQNDILDSWISFIVLSVNNLISWIIDFQLFATLNRQFDDFIHISLKYRSLICRFTQTRLSCVYFDYIFEGLLCVISLSKPSICLYCHIDNCPKKVYLIPSCDLINYVWYGWLIETLRVCCWTLMTNKNKNWINAVMTNKNIKLNKCCVDRLTLW